MRTRAPAVLLAVLLLVVVSTTTVQARKKKTPPAPEPAVAPAPTIVAEIGATKITREELNRQAERQLVRLRQQEYDVLFAALNELIDKKLIEAAAGGQDPEQWLKDQVSKRTPPPTDAEIESAYNQNKARLGGQTLEQAKPQLTTMLQNQAQQKARSAILAELKAANAVKILLDPPRIAVGDDGDPSQGPPTAPVTVVEFSDYECPYCSRGEATMKQVREAYGDRVRVVFRDFPLSFHRSAQKAAEAAGCADEQGKFWEMHDKLFANQKALAVDQLKAYAAELGLDAPKFNECLDSNRRVAEISKDLADGQAAGVGGTPAFFINGRLLGGAQPFENFAQLIDDELTRKGVALPPKPNPAEPGKK